MGTIRRGLAGAVSWGACIVAALAVVGCGSSDDKSSGPSCGTELAPDPFTVSNVTPARGSSMPNSGIVQSFTIVGQLIQVDPTLGEAVPTHTAGDLTPNPVPLMVAVSGQDTVYTFDPVTWATAPAHVELVVGGLFKDQTTGCVSQFPSPMFSYDITAP